MSPGTTTHSISRCDVVLISHGQVPLPPVTRFPSPGGISSPPPPFSDTGLYQTTIHVENPLQSGCPLVTAHYRPNSGDHHSHPHQIPRLYQRDACWYCIMHDKTTANSKLQFLTAEPENSVLDRLSTIRSHRVSSLPHKTPCFPGGRGVFAAHSPEDTPLPPPHCPRAIPCPKQMSLRLGPTDGVPLGKKDPSCSPSACCLLFWWASMKFVRFSCST